MSLACSGRGLNNDQPVLSDDERKDLFHLFVLSRTTMKTPTAFVRPYLLLILLFGGYGLLVVAMVTIRQQKRGEVHVRTLFRSYVNLDKLAVGAGVRVG